MLIAKCLLMFLFLYGKNIVETTDTSAVASPSSVACDDSDCKTGGSDSGLAFGNEVNSDYDGLTASGANEADGGSDHQGLTYGAANEADAGGDDQGLTSGGVNGADGTSIKLRSPTSELKLFKTGPDGNKFEIKPTECYEDNYLGNLTYAFKPGVECTLVKFEDKDVWKKGDQQVDEPKSVTYDSILEEVTVRDADNSVHFAKETDTGVTVGGDHGSSSGLTSEDAEESTGPGSTAETSPGDGDKTGEKVEEDEDSKAGTPSPPAADAGSDDTSSGEGTETADGSADKGAGEGTGTGGEGEDGSSQPSGGDGGSSATPPASSGGDATTANPDRGATATPTPGATDIGTKTGVELSLKKTSGTNEFSYNKVGNVATFTAKSGFGFSSVKTKTGGSCGSGGSDVAIWEASNPNEYAAKVVLEGKGDKNKKEVTIHLPNGTTKAFTRDGKGKPWNEYTGPLPSTGQSDGTKGIKLSKADPNDATKTVELDSSEYKLKKLGDDHLYTFDKGPNCTLLKIEGKEVWKYDSSKHSGKYPKSLTYNTKDSKIILNFTDLLIVCEKDGDNYKNTEFDKKTAVQLDIKQSSGTDEFDCKKDGKNVTFTAKDKYGFNVVRCKNIDYDRWVDIWKTENEIEFANKIVNEGGNKLTIHIGEGTSASTKVFNKGGYCEWTEDTKASTQATNDKKKSGTEGSGGGTTKQSKPATQ